MLGTCCGSGIGVPKNDTEAYKWLSLAAAHSWQDSSLGGDYQSFLTYEYTNILSLMNFCETNMSREEIVEAQRLAAFLFVGQKPPQDVGLRQFLRVTYLSRKNS